MNRRNFAAAAVVAGAAVIAPSTAKAEGDINAIDFVDASPTAHRDAINAMLLALSGPEHPFPPEFIDQRAELPPIDADDLYSSLVTIRRLLIRAGIGIQPE